MNRVKRQRGDALDTPLGLIGGLLMYGGVATLMHLRGWRRSFRAMTRRQHLRFLIGITLWAGIALGLWGIGVWFDLY